MKQVVFSGHSDDILMWTPHDAKWTGDEAYVSGNDEAAFKVFRKKEDGTEEGFYVFGKYGYNKTQGGCWIIGIQQFDEDVPVPDWGLRLGAHKYSVLLFVDALPDDAEIEVVGRDYDD